MFAFVFLLALLQPAQFCATFEQQFKAQTTSTVPPFICNPNKIVNGDIQFTKEFCAIPQILISNLWYQNQGSFFSFKIFSQSTTGFLFYLACGDNYLSYYTFEWVAFIDDRMFVNNDLLQQITLIDGYRTQLFPYPIQNTNYADLTVSATILSYGGGTPKVQVEQRENGYNLYVNGVTNQQVAGLGVQIVVGLKSIFYLLAEEQVPCSRQYDFVKQYPTDKITNIKIYTLKQILEAYITGIACQAVFSTSLRFTCLAYCPDTSTLNVGLFIYNTASTPHYYKKIRVSQLMSMDHRIMNTFNTQKIYFIENNKTWSDLDTTTIPSINYNKKTLSLIVYHSCQPNRKITITILRNDNQGEYNYIYYVYCHRLYNLITMYMQLYQSTPKPSSLQFRLTNSGFQIQQVLDSGDTYQLLNIQF